MQKFSTFLGYLGSAFMIAFSFTMVVHFAIIGLTLITVQVGYNKTWNLVAVNIVSLIGFFLQIM